MNLKNKESFTSKDTYDILIFVQAPADLRYALSICEKNEGKQILLCVVNVQSVYRFVKELSIQNTEVIFIEYIYFSSWKIWNFHRKRKEFNLIYKQIDRLSFNDVYFFSRIDDWITCGIVGRLTKKTQANFYYYKHYDDLGLVKMSRLSFAYWRYFWIRKIVSNITSVYFVSRYFGKALEFAFWKYSVKEIDQSKEQINVSKKYLYKIPKKGNTTVIFFVSQEDIDFITEKSNNKLKNFLNKAQTSDWFICLKGHPRIGNPETIRSFFHFVVPNYVPSEFLDYNDVDIVLGVGSAAVVYPINTNVSVKAFSIVKDLEFKNPEQKDSYIKYLDEFTDNKIQYISLIELGNMLKGN
ncbi:hypothetical protein [Capnocytophaga felis]|uniref:Uncharacterized protein n=1 Tax=Capnocytophaga felis TaxID=2267611 RepID=A0A5M4B6Z0_9FLAO|nr:hypothetical protein [Capnocytophaga felis]GET45288.1 hypothetical protein RCZ01_05900 [Capnocytophaga felis]GET47549.1 hypothetical protein RCZ02_03800 [Capnocytophaga felis]